MSVIMRVPSLGLVTLQGSLNLKNEGQNDTSGLPSHTT